MIRAVLLEIEGVLVQTAEARRHALEEALASRHHVVARGAIDPTRPVRLFQAE